MDDRNFWNRFARIYDHFMMRFSPEYTELIARIADDVGEAQRVLEVATGTGLIALELGEKHEVDAIDISPAMIAQAEEKMHARGLAGIRFQVGSAYDLPWQDNKFDVAICANALHVMEQPERALDEMKRVLKGRGKLIAPTYCHNEDWRARFASFFMRLTGFKVYSRYSTSELQDLFEANGFSIESADKSKETIPLYYMVARSL
jgi:phosphatidylethanolamine/phosphatidyl-N-methylethanolamine N-methyltransferase